MCIAIIQTLTIKALLSGQPTAPDAKTVDIKGFHFLLSQHSSPKLCVESAKL